MISEDNCTKRRPVFNYTMIALSIIKMHKMQKRKTELILTHFLWRFLGTRHIWIRCLQLGRIATSPGQWTKHIPRE